jgi:Holliday junction resolvase RusA-like endonuclease
MSDGADMGAASQPPRVALVIPGKPFAKQRHRVGAIAGRARAFNTKANVQFEDTVKTIALRHFPAPLEGAVRVTISATFVPAESWSKKKRAEFLHRPHTQRPDLDNLAKAIKDGLNRVAWGDDSQVAELHCRKVWGVVEQTVVWVEAIGAV